MYGQCKICNRFASLNRYKICDRCYSQDEELLAKAREKLHEEIRKSIFEVAEELEIDASRIFLWVEQGRLPKKNLKYLCPKCGCDMLNGMCDCQMEELLYRAPEPEPEPVKPPQRFYANRRVLEKCRKYWEEKSIIRRRQKRDIWVS